MYFQQVVLLFASALTFSLLLCSLFGNHWMNQKVLWNTNKNHLHNTLQSSKEETIQVEVLSHSGLWNVCCDQSNVTIN